MSHSQDPLPLLALTPLEATFDNSEFDWLTFETVGNKVRFRKSNQPRRLGFYLLNLESMQIWVREFISKEALAILTESFCPDSEPEDVASISDSLWSWKARKVEKVVTSLSQSPAIEGPAKEEFTRSIKSGASPKLSLSASREKAVIHRGIPRALMPFNYWDNDIRSEGLGTDPTKPAIPAYDKILVGPPRQLKCKPLKDWHLWRTASRSCVMEIGRVIPKHAPMGDCEHPTEEWLAWPWKTVGPDWKAAEAKAEFAKGAYRLSGDGWSDEREYLVNLPEEERGAPNKLKYINAAFAEDVAGKDHFQLPKRNPYHFSIKTGVCWVGFSDQQYAHKDIIGDWIVGSLRSDYVAEIDFGKLAAATWPRYQDILCQTELFAIIEKPSGRCDNSLKHGQDGVAVRDLSILLTDRVYLPPLSVPMLGPHNHELAEEFSLIDDEPWCAFWRENYAEALGRAKALLLLRYGLQHGNPNVQNYLLEFKKGDGALLGPSRVLIRDLQDAALHREVVWALYGPGGSPPLADRISGDLDDAYVQLTQLNIPSLRFQFAEFSERDIRGEETGSTNSMFGPPGTQLGWFRFSTFFSAEKFPKEFTPQRQFSILSRMLEWGFAHACTLVRTVEECLGCNIWEVDWASCPGPERYRGKNSDSVREAFRKGTYTPVKSEDGTLLLTSPGLASASSKKIWELMLAQEKMLGGTSLADEFRLRMDSLENEILGKTYASEVDRNKAINEIVALPKNLITNPRSPLFVDGAGKLVERAMDVLDRLVFRDESPDKFAGLIIGMPPDSPFSQVDKPKAGKPTFQAGGMPKPPSREERRLAWLNWIEQWAVQPGPFSEMVEKVRILRAKLIAEAVELSESKEDLDLPKSVVFWYQKKFLDATAAFYKEKGLDGWERWVSISISGAGFTPETKVSVLGYPCQKVFWENPTRLYCGFEQSTGLSDDIRCNALTITVTEGTNTVTLIPKLEGDLPWEENIGTVVHKLLRSMQGQDAIRSYRDRKWEPVPPKFFICVVDWERRPLAHHLVDIIGKDLAVCQPTSRSGQIPFWGDIPLSEYKFPNIELLEGNTYMQCRALRLQWFGCSAVIDGSTYTTTVGSSLSYSLFRGPVGETRYLDADGVDIVEHALPGLRVQVESHGGHPVDLVIGKRIHVPGDAEHFGQGVGFDVLCEFA